ncbi:MAG: hypothetical protein MSH66_06360 [Bacteroidales bacterium]|nr:hypothetical protein [Bacteroidales bacterium]
MKKLYFSPRCTVYDLHTEQQLLSGSTLETSQEVAPGTTTGNVTNEFSNKFERDVWGTDHGWPVNE